MAIGISSANYQSNTSDYPSQTMVDSYGQGQGITNTSKEKTPWNISVSEKLPTGQAQSAGFLPMERDTFELSPQMQAALDKAMGKPSEKDNPADKKVPGSNSGEKKTENKPENSASAQKAIAELKSIDQRVRSHEMAHLAAAGGLAKGGASYSYQTGPDGKRYAVGGEVSIDTKAVDGDPRATLVKAYQIQRAALAPPDPSPQDRAVAANASSMAAQAQAELNKRAMSIKAPAQQQSSPPQQPIPVSSFGKKSYSSEIKLAQTNQAIGITRFDFGV